MLYLLFLAFVWILQKLCIAGELYMTKKYQDFDTGAWVNAQYRATFENRNPAVGNPVVGKFPKYGKEDVDLPYKEVQDSKQVSLKLGGKNVQIIIDDVNWIW